MPNSQVAGAAQNSTYMLCRSEFFHRAGPDPRMDETWVSLPSRRSLASADAQDVRILLAGLVPNQPADGAPRLAAPSLITVAPRLDPEPRGLVLSFRAAQVFPSPRTPDPGPLRLALAFGEAASTLHAARSSVASLRMRLGVHDPPAPPEEFVVTRLQVTEDSDRTATRLRGSGLGRWPPIDALRSPPPSVQPNR